MLVPAGVARRQHHTERVSAAADIAPAFAAVADTVPDTGSHNRSGDTRVYRQELDNRSGDR